MSNPLKEKLKNQTPKEIFSASLFITCFVLMTILAIFRFCGIGYFANTYQPQECNPVIQNLILFALKWFELYFILAMLCHLKWWKILLISFVWANIYWFVHNNIICFVLDIAYYTIIPFFVNKFDYKYITYGLMVVIVISLYQFIMMQARYTINVFEKFNYIAMIASILDYKLFVVSMYLFVYNRRIYYARRNKEN